MAGGAGGRAPAHPRGLVGAGAKDRAGESREAAGCGGNCFTGILPLALLGQPRELRALAAPVLSQPSLPFPSCDWAKKRSVGIAPAELARARARLVRRNLEVLGFRFEGDEVSPGERFARLSRELNEATGALHFRDATLPAAQYHVADRLPLRAHPVLTDGFRRWLPGHAEPATHYAYRELIAFLDAKLKHAGLRRYVPPPHLAQPPTEAAAEAGGCPVEEKAVTRAPPEPWSATMRRRRATAGTAGPVPPFPASLSQRRHPRADGVENRRPPLQLRAIAQVQLLFDPFLMRLHRLHTQPHFHRHSPCL